MDTDQSDLGVFLALIHRFEKFRLPRAKQLHRKVMRGETLAESDILFLEDVFHTANDIAPLIERHPEYSVLVTTTAALYKEITEKALENETTS